MEVSVTTSPVGYARQEDWLSIQIFWTEVKRNPYSTEGHVACYYGSWFP